MLTLHGISRLEGGAHDGIHLFWSPPFPTGHSLNGFNIYRRASKPNQKRQCRDLSLTALAEARKYGVTHVDDLTVWARPLAAIKASGPSSEWMYRIELGSPTNLVEINGNDGWCAFGGRADGTVLDGRTFQAGRCLLRGGRLSTVWIVAKSTKASFKVCSEEDDAGSWKSVKALVEHLQVPFRSVNTTVATEAQERALAATRAAPDSLSGSFSELSKYANLALQRPNGVAAFRVVAGRFGGAQDNWDLPPYPLAISAIVISEWNRALGFAHLDHSELVPGNSYDYRIVGTVPRADRDELRFDFHTVPRSYRLPQSFVLGPVTIWSSTVPVVQPEAMNGSPAVLRKGIKFRELSLDLAVPTSWLVIDGLSKAAVVARGFFMNNHVADRTALLIERTVFDFGSQVDRVVLEGAGFLVGVVPQPIAAGLDPKEPVEISHYLNGIAYVPTPPPAPPVALDVVTLADPARTARLGVRDANRGFEASWLPPPDIDPALAPWWPADAGSFMPTLITRYQLERKLGSGAFSVRPDTDGLHLGTRLVQTVTDTPAWGFDVLRAFPASGAQGVPTDERVRAIEVLKRAQLEYGDSGSYRIRSLDATGRESVPVTCGPVMLRKLTRPPVPTSPPDAAPPVEPDTPRTGIQVRLLQANDPDLTPADAALTSAGDVVVVRWGWGHEERVVDPYVTEFRVYEHGAPLIELSATLSGPVTAVGSGWQALVTFSRPVIANEFVGRVVTFNDAFAIVAHGAGTTVSVSFDASVRSPTTAPAGTVFTVLRTTGAQLQPEYWDRRVLVVPRVSDPTREDDPSYVEEYTVTLPASWIAVTPARPRQRAAIGVTAADAQSYVSDRRPLEPIQRPGNESTVSCVEVTARYRGQPTLAVADLADINERVLRRLAASDSFHVFTPAAVAPAGSALTSLMRLERVPASAVLPRLLIRADAILLQPAQGAPVPWTLSSADEAALRAGWAARSIPNRFLAHAAARLDGLDAQASKVGDIDPTREVSDRVPNTPARWIYRLRAVDAAGHLSDESQVLALVLRIPSPARSTAPEMLSMTLEGANARLTLRSRGTDPAQILVFTSLDPRQRLAKASLATVRNRPDLAPISSVVVRDDRGVRLASTSIQIAANADTFVDFALPDGHRLLAWSLSISADGIPSPLVGPLHISRGYLSEVG